MASDDPLKEKINEMLKEMPNATTADICRRMRFDRKEVEAALRQAGFASRHSDGVWVSTEEKNKAMDRRDYAIAKLDAQKLAVIGGYHPRRKSVVDANGNTNPYNKHTEHSEYINWYTKIKKSVIKTKRKRHPINGKENPFDFGTQRKKYNRRNYYMSVYNCEPPIKKTRLGCSGRNKVSINGKTNPYHAIKQMKEHKHWFYHMKKYGTEPPTKENKEKHEFVGGVGLDYNRPRKNLFREKVVQSFKNLGGNCLCLESPALLFAKELPEMGMVVCENNKEQFDGITRNLGSVRNIKAVFFSDVMNAPVVAAQYDFSCAFLDYCGVFRTHEQGLVALKEKLSKCSKIAFTFAVRDNQWEWQGDYKFQLTGRLLSIFDGFEVEYGESYRDGASMVGVILVRKGFKPKEVVVEKRRLISTKKISDPVFGSHCIERKLKKDFDECAKKEGVSVNKLITRLMTEHVSKHPEIARAAEVA